MTNLLYTIAGIMIVTWLLGYFVFSVGAAIHVLPILAVIVVIAILLRGDKVKKNNY